VYWHFVRWRDDGSLEELHDTLRGRVKLQSLPGVEIGSALDRLRVDDRRGRLGVAPLGLAHSLAGVISPTPRIREEDHDPSSRR
jgi:hypothetical protein